MRCSPCSKEGLTGGRNYCKLVAVKLLKQGQHVNKRERTRGVGKLLTLPSGPSSYLKLQESFSMSRHDFREVPALDVPMDNSTDAELMMLDCKDSSPTIGR